MLLKKEEKCLKGKTRQPYDHIFFCCLDWTKSVKKVSFYCQIHHIFLRFRNKTFFSHFYNFNSLNTLISKMMYNFLAIYNGYKFEINPVFVLSAISSSLVFWNGFALNSWFVKLQYAVVAKKVAKTLALSIFRLILQILALEVFTC